MKFKTAAQQTCYEKIEPWVAEMCQEQYIPPNNMPIFIVPSGSATAMIEVLPWGETDSLITAWSYVVTGAETTAELMRFLLDQNFDLPFGAFSLDKDGDIRFHASLIGSSCDLNELKASVSAVLKAADDYDDKIIATWGGKRASDRMG
jgi:Putative bacterial sensory transduction regulator